jgi:protein transport protein SEC24
LRTAAVANEVFRSVDFLALTSVLTRSVVHCLRNTSDGGGTQEQQQRKAREFLYSQTVLMLASYRQNTPAMNSPMGQLILPDKMQLLPLFCMCLLKSPLLRPTMPRMIPGMQTSLPSPTCDERAYYTLHAVQAMCAYSMLLVHPNIFSILNWDENNKYGEWQGPDEVEQANGFVRMPPSIVPSMETTNDDDMYLIDDGMRIFLYIGQDVPEEVKGPLLSSLLADKNGNEAVPLASSASEVQQRIAMLVHQMRSYSSTTRGSESELRPTWAPLIPVAQQGGQHDQSLLENSVLDLMVADATAGGERDYVEFLCKLHASVRQRVEGEKK